MDEELIFDIRRSLEDALECEDWKCVEDALDMIKEYHGEFNIEDEEFDY